MTVRAVKLRLHSTALCTDVLRGVGFKARCACGWTGSTRDTHGEARAEGQHHRQTHRNG